MPYATAPCHTTSSPQCYTICRQAQCHTSPTPPQTAAGPHETAVLAPKPSSSH
uniref:Uncharacterized protein n=1 Tax=Arundo donax TaxID=35708 RepID=A0A0A9C275_ARUDO